jgi:CheY-like chemotaxis protein
MLLRLATEIRETLHQILGSIELAAEPSLSKEQADHLSQCCVRIDQLLRTANDISELALPEPSPYPPAPFRVTDVMDAVAELLGPRAARKGLDLRCAMDPSVPRYVIADRRMIESVLYRIVDNSIKSTEDGGITLSAKASVTGSGSAVIHFEVMDTGPGMPEGMAEGLSQPFDSLESRGLGLRVMKKRLAGIGGALDIVSSTSRGTTISVIAPVTITSYSSLTDPAELAAGDEGGAPVLKLLVAEDSDDSFAVFQTYVQAEGHRISRALNGVEAVEMVKAGQFDMVVMDVNMPAMDGYTATRAIREWETQGGRARLPIVLLSADDANRQARMGASVGCSGYLTKPIPKRDLLRALRHYAGAPSSVAQKN